MSVDWGDLPTWIAGVGAVIALFFARTAAVSARKASQLQAVQVDELRVESRRREEAERRAFAARVAVYIGVDRRNDQVRPIVRFVNAGDLPIYSLTVFCFTPYRTLVRRTYFVVGPTAERRTMDMLSERLATMFVGVDPGASIGAGELVAACAFRDAGGQWWYRTTQGELREAASGPVAIDSAQQSGPQTYDTVESIEDSPHGVEPTFDRQ